MVVFETTPKLETFDGLVQGSDDAFWPISKIHFGYQKFWIDRRAAECVAIDAFRSREHQESFLQLLVGGLGVVQDQMLKPMAEGKVRGVRFAPTLQGKLDAGEFIQLGFPG